jgi:hypothetical protein
MREEERRTEIFLETMGGGGQESGATPLKSCNKLFEINKAGSGIFKNNGYYRESTSIGVKEIIRRFEDIRILLERRTSKDADWVALKIRKIKIIYQDQGQRLTKVHGSPNGSNIRTTPSRRGRWARSPGPGPGGSPRPPGPAWGGGPRAAPGSTGSLGQASLTSLLLLWERGQSEAGEKKLLEPGLRLEERGHHYTDIRPISAGESKGGVRPLSRGPGSCTSRGRPPLTRTSMKISRLSSGRKQRS